MWVIDRIADELDRRNDGKNRLMEPGEFIDLVGRQTTRYLIETLELKPGVDRQSLLDEFDRTGEVSIEGKHAER